MPCSDCGNEYTDGRCIPVYPEVGQIWVMPRGEENVAALVVGEEDYGRLRVRFEDGVELAGVPWDMLQPNGGYEEPIGPERPEGGL